MHDNQVSTNTPMRIEEDKTIEKFEILLIELQHIFLDIFSNYRRRDLN